MIEFDERTRGALLAREGPPQGAQDAILARLRGDLGATVLGGSRADEGADFEGEPDGQGFEGRGGESAGTSSGAGASTQLAWVGKIVGATVGLTTSGLLALTLGAAGVREARAPAEVEAAPTGSGSDSGSDSDSGSGRGQEGDGGGAVDGPARAQAKARAQGEATERSPVLLQEGSQEERTKTEPRVVKSRGAEGRVAAGSGSEAGLGPTSALAEEVALLRAAKGALAHGAPSRALAILDEHRARFPEGALAPERELLSADIRGGEVGGAR